jgi:beta-lactamase superfamily II metal-dependent hydrolase
LILTGWDADHANPEGVGMVTRNFDVDKVWVPRWPNDTEAAKDVRRLLKQARWTSGYDVYHPSTDNQRRVQVGDTPIEIFSPHPQDATSPNNRSIVAKLESPGMSVLVTGDCEKPRWDSILTYFSNRLRADVLAAPHHGSRNGITKDALNAIRPKLVLISAGDNAAYGHPHKEALGLFRAHVGEHIVVTKDSGSIRAWAGENGSIRYEWDAK